jgi:hypothetical protein
MEVFEDRELVLRRISGHKRKEVTQENCMMRAS